MRVRRKHTPHKRNQENRRTKQTLHCDSENQLHNVRIYNRHQIPSISNATRQTNNETSRNTKSNKPIPRRQKNEVKFRSKSR